MVTVYRTSSVSSFCSRRNVFTLALIFFKKSLRTEFCTYIYAAGGLYGQVEFDTR